MIYERSWLATDLLCSIEDFLCSVQDFLCSVEGYTARFCGQFRNFGGCTKKICGCAKACLSARHRLRLHEQSKHRPREHLLKHGGLAHQNIGMDLDVNSFLPWKSEPPSVPADNPDEKANSATQDTPTTKRRQTPIHCQKTTIYKPMTTRPLPNDKATINQRRTRRCTKATTTRTTCPAPCPSSSHLVRRRLVVTLSSPLSGALSIVVG